MRVGAASISLSPSEPAQRRYEAMRAYFVDGLAAGEVATRFGYSPASVHQMASELRAGSAQYFRSSKPGPRSAAQGRPVRDRVLELRALDRSVEEIAAELTLAGTPVSAQTVWTILDAEGIERLPRRTGPSAGAPPTRSPRSRPVRSRTGRPARRPAAAITPACSCSYRRSPSSDSRTRSRRAATRQRRCSRPGTRSGRCCCTSARATPRVKPRARAR